MINTNIIKRNAYAKLNLHLEVLNKREDNFHNLLSLMTELDLHDVITLQEYEIFNTKTIDIEIINDGGLYSYIIENIPIEQNLISVAIKNYLQRINHGGFFRFTLEKNIPSGAGLGGGSSNAACTLNILSSIIHVNGSDIINSAIETGSDVPFFLGGGISIVEGKGGLLSPVNTFLKGEILLINNGLHINTGDAYRSLERTSSYNECDIVINRKKLLETIEYQEMWKQNYKNDFENIVFTNHPEIGLIKKRMYELGAIFASMTGTGSTIFGIFDNSSIVSAYNILQAEGHNVIQTKFRNCQ